LIFFVRVVLSFFLGFFFRSAHGELAFAGFSLCRCERAHERLVGLREKEFLCDGF